MCNLRARGCSFLSLSTAVVFGFLLAACLTVTGEQPAEAQRLPTFRKTTRLVVVDVVARDKHGNPVTDLHQDELQVFESLDWLRRVPQRVASFRAVAASGTESRQGSAPVPASLPQGVAASGSGVPNGSLPPTILLMDAINTPILGQLNVIRRMGEILDTVPAGSPVAIYVMGARLKVVQKFTTDRALLKAMSARAYSLDYSSFVNPFGVSLEEGSAPDVDRRSLYATAEIGLNPHAALKDAFVTLGRQLSGIPGRKNLIWITDSLPMAIPDQVTPDKMPRFYWSEYVEPALRALSDARVSVYPVSGSGLTGGRLGDDLRSGTMLTAADETGGRACFNTNDLTGCVKKALEHGQTYYELSYYPTADAWLHGLHRVVIKTTRPGVTLSYRRGYYGDDTKPPRINPDKPLPEKTKRDPELQRAACDDSLTAGSLLFVSRPVAPDRAGNAKFALVVDGRELSFHDMPDGQRKLRLDFAVCTFDRQGMPLTYMQHDTEEVLSDAQYQSVTTRGFPHNIEFAPNKNQTGLRLVVRDALSGLVGSVDLAWPPQVTAAAALTAPEPAAKLTGASGQKRQRAPLLRSASSG